MSRVFIAAIVMTVIPVTAQTPAAPMLPDTNPEWYQRRDTWQETVRLSREAIARHLAATPGVIVPGAPQGVRFSPWQVIGPFDPPAGHEGFDYAYPPEQEIDFSKTYDKLRWKRWTRPDGHWHGDIDLADHRSMYLFRTVTAQTPDTMTVYIGVDDRAKVWLNGRLVGTVPGVSRGTAVKLPLDAGENQLLVKYHNNTGGKGCSFSMTPNTMSGSGEDNSPAGILWGLVDRDFRDAAAQRRIRWEREDAIWDADWRAGGLPRTCRAVRVGDSHATVARCEGSRTGRESEEHPRSARGSRIVLRRPRGRGDDANGRWPGFRAVAPRHHRPDRDLRRQISQGKTVSRPAGTNGATPRRRLARGGGRRR